MYMVWRGAMVVAELWVTLPSQYKQQLSVSEQETHQMLLFVVNVGLQIFKCFLSEKTNSVDG